MALKRNLKLYIKEKSTWIALGVCLFFIILFSVSYLPSLKNKKGINDSFKNYSISFITTNNYNVIYAACDHYLFYSQNKAHQSTLNDFAGIKDYSNAYGNFNPKENNFIRIDYEFSSKIIDVQGISDNLLGEGGETIILTQNGNVYMISQRSNQVQLLLQNVEKIRIKKDYDNNRNIYLIMDQNHCLYQCFFSDDTLIKQKLYEGILDDFYYLNSKENIDNYIIQKENNIYLMSVENIQEEYLQQMGNAYAIKENMAKNLSTWIDLNLPVEKMVQINNQFYLLNDFKVTKLDFDDEMSVNEIVCQEKITDIYTCGENACIAITDKGLYYCESLKFYEESITQFEKINVKDGLVYGSRNALIHYSDNQRLYLWNDSTNEFEIMYLNIFVCYILRYFSLFVIAMTLFYLILSFLESNKRYNRYFRVNNKK